MGVFVCTHRHDNGRLYCFKFQPNNYFPASHIQNIHMKSNSLYTSLNSMRIRIHSHLSFQEPCIGTYIRFQINRQNLL